MVTAYIWVRLRLNKNRNGISATVRYNVGTQIIEEDTYELLHPKNYRVTRKLTRTAEDKLVRLVQDDDAFEITTLIATFMSKFLQATPADQIKIAVLDNCPLSCILRKDYTWADMNTIAHTLARKAGVDIGKYDYIHLATRE